MTENRLQSRYRLGDVIASGGMAEVYRAYDEFLGRDVAVKVFRASATAELDFRRQEDEVNLLARLNHPNLVTLLDASVDRTDPGATRIYYVMELVEGTDLKRRLDEGPLVARQVAQLGYYAASGLEHVHAHQIVHRDIKPANILLTFNEDGTRVTAKLGDFGVASIGPAEPIGDDEIVTGTVAYLSPEQARGEEVGPASDVYSLGLVLLQCFTGVLAFPGPAEASQRGRLERDPELAESVPEEWVPLLRAMTAREPSQRPDIHDVAIALRQMFAAESGRHRAMEHQEAEPARLDGVLGAPSDEALDRITSLASRVLRAPVALLSVVDGHGARFLSTHGVDLAEALPDLAQTASAILRDEPWVIEDALADPRALENPLVAEQIGPQFYAGVPITASDGTALGTLCVLDDAPRSISLDELAILADLAGMVTRELELRRVAGALVTDNEEAWLDSPDTDESGALITNRSATGPIQVDALS